LRNRKPKVGNRQSTDWGKVAKWYDDLVGEEGSEFQKEIIFPGVLRMLAFKPDQKEKVLDIACGQGAFCRLLQDKGAEVTGVDAATELIKLARDRSDPTIKYIVGDARDLSFLPEKSFSAASCILAIQNIDKVQPVFDSVARILLPGGRFAVVMMHPAFRGPKSTRWGWDDKESVQFRRVDRYLLPRKEPIVTHPGQKTGEYTWTFHRPMQTYIRHLRNAGLLVDHMEEWPSHKKSTSGPRAPAENRAREEIPMFLALRAVKPSPASDK
jgi:ubiquinone/menaquinone biosynthesis C-methylase UbiE